MFQTIQHINLCAGPRPTDAATKSATVEQIQAYYHETIGLPLDLMPGSPLAESRWFRIGSVDGEQQQQIHFGFEDETFQAGSLSVVRCSVFFLS